MAVIQSSDLDFYQIKENLKTYLQQQPEFSDYNFEASGLSNILDVLAYNTHVNGLVANMGINESFLSSAQLRSSVVSHAENLGYYPRSKTASTATVTLTVSTTDTATASLTLPKYTTFSTSVDDVSYSFQTLEALTANNDGTGVFSFTTAEGVSNITLYEGAQKTKTFFVGNVSDEQVFVIPDENIDTSTMVVNVFDTSTSSSFKTYQNVNDVSRINASSSIYIVRETPNGFYELTFSDGSVLGTSPAAGNKVVVSYLQATGAAANGATTFIADDQVTVGSTDFNITIATTSNSAGGAEKETIASIKSNAPLQFASQQRLVTAEDYNALILSNFSSVLDDVISWGGNDNVPPVYGRVYVSLNFKDGITSDVQQVTKDQIITQLSDNLAIMSIDTVFADPAYAYLELTTTFNFDPDLSGNTSKTTETIVQNAINTYITSNLNTFGKVFRKSNVLAEVDDISPSILNSEMTVKMQVRFTPAANEMGRLLDFTNDIIFPARLATPSTTEYIITSTTFEYNTLTVSIRNRLGSNTLQLVDEQGVVRLDNAGSYDAAEGTVNLTGVTIGEIGDTPPTIKVSAIPADQNTIKPLRNYIITIDPDVSFSAATIDYQNTASVIS